jgi:hypothetical protein
LHRSVPDTEAGTGGLKQKERHGYFMQDGATAHTDIYSINVLNKVFEDRLISCRLWPERSPDLNPWDFYL